MALKFGAAISDRVNCGSGGSIDDLVPYTMIVWIYPTTLTASVAIMQKGRFGTSTAKGLSLGVASDELDIGINRASVATSYITNNANLAINNWYFIAVVYDPNAGVGEVVQVYVGDVSTLAAECTYGTSADGSGTTNSDAGETLFIGNNPANDSAFTGHIAHAQYHASALSLAQVQNQQFFPHVTSTCMFFMRFNNSTTGTQLDQSGFQNNGTVTGATVSTVADPANVVFDHFPKANIIRPRPFKPGLPR